MVSALAGCADLETYHGDLAFDASERADIEASADVMAQRTGAPRMRIEWDGDIGDERNGHRIVRAVPPADATAWGEFVVSPGKGALGFTMYLSPAMPRGELRIAAEHELGHWYGLTHHAEKGLMNPWGGEWSDADVAVCRAAQKCY